MIGIGEDERVRRSIVGLSILRLACYCQTYRDLKSHGSDFLCWASSLLGHYYHERILNRHPSKRVPLAVMFGDLVTKPCLHYTL